MNNQQTNTPKRYSLVPNIDDLTGFAQKTSGGSNSLLSSQDSLNSDPFRVFDYSLSNGKKLTGIVEPQSSSNSDIDGVNLPIAPSQQLAPYVANQLIVKFQKGVTDAQIEHIKNGLGIVSTKTIGLTGAEVWKLSGTTSVENALARYQSNSLFEYIEPDYKVSPTSGSSSFSVANQKLTSVNPTLSNSSSTMAVSPSSGIDGVNLPIAPSQQLAPYVANQLIVKFKEGVTAIQIEQIKNDLRVVSTKTISLTGAQVWKFSEISVESALAKYSTSSLFEYIEPDYIVTAGALTPKSTIPNDPSFTQLWGLNNTGQSGGTVDADIDAPEAWDIQTGNPNLVVGVIDTGVDYNHQDLVGNIWTNPGEIAADGIDNDGNGYIDDVRGWDFAYNDNNPMDVYGHGTHVSGTIAGKGNNGIGVTGVAWNAQIMPLKFLDDSGSGSTSNAILAISYATAKGVKITNNSWGGGNFSQALYDAINAAGQLGALFIAAAGNDANDNDANPSYPASYNLANIVSVAATNRNDQLVTLANTGGWWGSSYGLTSVDLGAPGSDIYSTTPGNTYSTYSGTSMATPHVSGAAALLWSQNPTWTAQQVKTALMNTGDSLASLAGKTVSGKRLNVYNALAASNLPSVTVSVSPTSVQEDGTTNLVYTFTRTNLNLSSPLTVNFGIDGTANAAPVGSDPTDYNVLTNSGVTFNPTTKLGTVTFAANATTATVVVDPITDTVQEDNETVNLTINSGNGYIGGAPGTATGTIISEEGFTTFFSDSFANNNNGWTLGTEWQIGPATVSTGQIYGNPDPGVDYTPTTDNGVAGVVIGGNASTALHDFYYFTSPIINTSTANNLFFEYARWLNSDYTPFIQNTVDVFNGSSWVNLWSSGESPGVTDDAWTPQKFDISTYKSASTQIRFGFNVGNDGAYTVSSWNIDDVKFYGDGGSTLPVITVAATDASAAETIPGATTNPGKYTLTRTGVTTSALTVNVLMSGTATNGTDYTSIPTTATFAIGSTTALVNLNVIDDILVEQTIETAILTVGTGTGYTVGTTPSATVNITDNDVALPVITVAATDASAAETIPGATTNPGQYTLTRTGVTTSALTVNVLMSGTATNGTDYTSIPTTATFAIGSTTALVNLNVIDDILVEQTIETAILTVGTGTGYTVGTTPSATVNITDNDVALPVITVAATDASAAETIPGATTNPGQYTLTRTGVTTSALTVNVLMSGTATNGTDYTSIPTTATFAIGSTTALVNLNVIDDILVEQTIETAILTVGTGTGYTVGTTPSAAVNITDNDVALPVITVAATDASAAETIPGATTNPGQYTLTRTGPITSALTVNVTKTGTATNGVDYTSIPTTVTFNAGSATALVPLNVIYDTLVEATETAILNVTAGNGYTVGTSASATVSIADGPLPVLPSITLASNYSGVSENGKTNLVYTFNRTGATTSPLTVNFGVSGTAINGDDYVAYGGAFPTPTQGTITFAVGATTAQLALVTSGDTVKEINETIGLTLTSGTGYQIGTPTVVTTTILNDDGVLNQQGTTGNDVIEAGSTSTLSGKAGNDILIGSSASNILVGGAGNDTLTTGTGFDTVLFTTKTEGIDTITDFNVYQDLIQVSAVNFGGGLIAGESISSDQFSISLGSVTANTRFIFDKPTGKLFFDIDGSGSNSSVQFASLTANLGLTADNIFAA
jgi:subtilisin family serine protease/Ca2+-binding RTX toxin-like protein